MKRRDFLRAAVGAWPAVPFGAARPPNILFILTDDLGWGEKRGMPNWLDPAVTTHPPLLKQAGYAAAHFGKWRLGSGQGAPEPSAYGIDDYRTVNANGPGWDERDPYFRAKSTYLRAARDGAEFSHRTCAIDWIILSAILQARAAGRDDRAGMTLRR